MSLLSEELMFLGQAAKHFPRDGRGRAPSATTLWRWRTRGIKGIRLETARLGGRVVTSLEAVRRFMRRLTDESQPPPDSARPGPERAAERMQASARLDQLWRT